MDLQSANLSELMPELIQAISQLGNLSKDKQGYGYKYAELSKVLDACRPILAEHNLVITQLVTVLNEEPTLVTTLFHKSGQFLRSCYPREQYHQDVENLRKRLLNKTKEQIEEEKLYDKSINWLKENNLHDLIDEYNLMYKDFLLNLI